MFAATLAPVQQTGDQGKKPVSLQVVTFIFDTYMLPLINPKKCGAGKNPEMEKGNVKATLYKM